VTSKKSTFRNLTQTDAPLASILRKPLSGLRIGSLLMLLVATTTPGCLLGPPIEGLPQEELHAPRIARDLVAPPLDGVIEVGIVDECISQKFALGRVSDKNVDDNLVVRWFLDWNGPEEKEDIGIVRDANLPSTGTVDRTDPIPLSYNLQLDNFLLNEAEPHTITVVVADRVLLNDVGIGFPNNEDGREGQYDLYQWTFFLRQGAPCTEPRL